MPMNFKIVNKNEGSDFFITQVDDANGVSVYEVYFKPEQPCVPKKIKVEFQIPYVEATSLWNPQCGLQRNMLADWKLNRQTSKSRLASGIPIQSVIAHNGENTFTLSVTDPKTPIEISCGVEEADKTCLCRVTFFPVPVGRIKEYRSRIIINCRKQPFYNVIAETVAGMRKAPQVIPEAACQPVYSTWYNFHQDIRDSVLLAECERAYALGMQTIIVDDGWQTDNKDGGYLYCGEWRICQSKIRNIRTFVEAIHRIGMKVMFWFSIPYVGKNTTIWQQFQGKYLDNEGNKWNCLDPRYPDVREYLIGIYESAIKDWNIDGFKLDFIDSFELTDYSNTDYAGMDFPFLEDAVERLLEDITSRLRKVKPEVLLEFRQTYIGPIISQYGNMLRVNDCPLDAMANRVGVLDLRLTSGKAAVHSDMVTWNKNESNEYVAKQLIAVLFAVPQISVILSELSPEHHKTLQFWLDFWIQHKKTLLDGTLKIYNPEIGYSMAEAELNDESICVCYSRKIVSFIKRKQYIVNGTEEKGIAITGNGIVQYAILNCQGNTEEDGIRDIRQISMFDVPVSGVLYITENGNYAQSN